MTNIIDRRQDRSTDLANKNRQRYLQKQKDSIDEYIENIIEDGDSIEDIANAKSHKIDVDYMHEHSFTYNSNHRKKTGFIYGNKDYVLGDKIHCPDMDKQPGSGQGEGGQDDFSFIINQEEFINCIFDGLDLPNFIKKGGKNESIKVLQRSGYSRTGIPARLDLTKTFLQSFMRRMASKGKKKKPRFLDDEDLRYKFYDYKDKFIKTAHVYFVMDVSGSMEENMKMIAKKFFLLYYLFLSKKYKKVDITFIRYHSEAEVCSENDFFYSRETGGTIISEAAKCLRDHINEHRDSSTENIYVSWFSDGGFHHGSNDNQNAMRIIEEEVLPKVQFMNKIILENVTAFWGSEYATTMKLYLALAKRARNFVVNGISIRQDILKLFISIFGKKR